MQEASQMIREALRAAESADVGIQPAILMNLNIDHGNVVEYTDSYVNDAHRSSLAELLSGGWVVFRIQTEFGITGHVTKAYLAKMKAN